MELVEKQKIIDRKVEYFCDLWNNSLQNATSNFSGLTLYSPHLLLKDIMDEYKYQKLSNENNRKFFKRKIENYMERNLIKSNYFLEFHKLNEALGNKKYEIANEITRNLLNKFSLGKYFLSCFDELMSILFDESTDYQTIKTLTNDVIIEFLLKGKTLKQIKKMISIIFSKVKESKYENGNIRYHTSFPFESLKLKYEDIKTNQKVREQINNLSDEERIKTIKYLYEEKDTNFYVIFNIIGLKHSSKRSFKVKNVSFYSFFHYKVIKKDTDFYNENFGNSENKETLNALVPVIANNSYVAEELAREKLEGILSLVKVANMGNTYYEIKDEYIILNNKKDPIMMSTREKNNTEKQIETKKTRANYSPVEIADQINKKDYILKLLNAHMILNKKRNDFTELEEKLHFSLKWINSAENNENMEERLIEYWIAIENLVKLSKNEHTENFFVTKKGNELEKEIDIAQELISMIDSINICLSNTWNLFRTIQNKVFPFWSGQEEVFEISETILKKCNIKEKYRNNIMSIVPFVKNISLLKNKFNNQFMDEKTDYIEQLNKDNNFAYKTVNNLKYEISDDILYIYRFRNLIVHNANIGHSLLHYYTEKAKVYAIHLFLEMITLYEKDTSLTPLQILLQIKVEKDILLNKIKNTKINSFFEILENK